MKILYIAKCLLLVNFSLGYTSENINNDLIFEKFNNKNIMNNLPITENNGSNIV